MGRRRPRGPADGHVDPEGDPSPSLPFGVNFTTANALDLTSETAGARVRSGVRWAGKCSGSGGAMSRIIRDRIKRQLDEAEGYLMLGLPERALAILERRADWATMQFEASYL